MKTCSADGCDRNQFGGGYCPYHQYLRRRQGGDKFKRKSKPKEKIARRTPKREKDERQYKDQAREFFYNAVNDGTNICFFCGKKVTNFEGLHHLKGRTNDYLLDKEWWVTCHNKCHVDCYHMMDYEHKQLQTWWNEFLERLKAKDEGLWRKEARKEEKSHKLNPKLEFDNDDN